MRSRISIQPIMSVYQLEAYRDRANLPKEERLALAFPIRGEVRKPAAPVVTTPALPDTLQSRWALADELSPELQLALLSIRWTELGKACAARLRLDGVWCCDADREFIKRSGLSVPIPGKRYNKLTLQGQWKADDCAKIIAKKYGLHVVTRGGGYHAHTVQCCCGWHTQFRCPPDRKESNFLMWELRHLTEIGA